MAVTRRLVDAGVLDGTVISNQAFVSALDQARELEGKSQPGSALAWFLKAKQIYPNSDYARDGITRLVEDILPDDSTPTSSPQPGENSQETTSL